MPIKFHNIEPKKSIKTTEMVTSAKKYYNTTQNSMPPKFDGK